MPNRVPLVVDTSTLYIKELPSGDNLDLTGSGIVGLTGIGGTNGNFTGIVTASAYYIDSNEVISNGRSLRNITSIQVSGISTLGVTSATNLTSQQLNVSGISTFTAGPVFVGGGTSTGTASQLLQVTGGAYVSGNAGIGTTNAQYKLDVDGDINFTGIFYQNGSQFVASRWTSGSGTDIYRMSNVGIGTTNPLQKLQIGSVSVITSVEVTTTGIVGISTNLITGISTTGISLGFFVTNANVSSGTTVTSIGISTIGIGKTTSNVGIATTTFTFSPNVGFGTTGIIGIGTNLITGINTTGISLGFIVANANVSSGTTVTSIGISTIGISSTTSNVGIATTTFDFSFNVGTGSIGIGTNFITGISTAGISLGLIVTNANVSSGTTVTSIGISTVGISIPTTNAAAIVNTIFTFTPDNTKVFVVTSNGDVGIGTDNPRARLDITGTTSSDMVRINQLGSGNALVVESGNIGIGTTNPTSKLQIGSVSISPSIGVTTTGIIGIGTNFITGISTSGISLGFFVTNANVSSGTIVTSIGISTVGISIPTTNVAIATTTGIVGISTNIITGINTTGILPGFFVTNANVSYGTTVTSIGIGTIGISSTTSNVAIAITTGTIGIGTNLITGISTIGISLGLIVTNANVSSGTTVTSISASTIGIGKTTSNVGIATTAFTFSAGASQVISTATGTIGIGTNLITGISTNGILPGFIVTNANVSYGTTVTSIGIGTIGISSTTSNVGIATTAFAFSVGITTFSFSVGVTSFTFTPDNTRVFVVTGNGFVGIGTTNPLSRLSIGSVSGFQDTITGITTTAATSIDTFAVADYRSSKMQIQITQGTDYQASDVLVIHNGTTANIIEYGSIATNNYLGNFSADISSTHARLLVTMSSASSATVKVLSQRITV